MAAQHGILIKSGEALEKMSALAAVVFDKTGTLTEGAPAVVDCSVLDDKVRAVCMRVFVWRRWDAQREDERLQWWITRRG